MLTRWCGGRLALARDHGLPVERLLPFLAAGERSLADDIRPKSRRRDFVLGRIAAHRAIRRATGLWTPAVEVRIGTQGEPVVHGDHRVQVSVSHTKGLAAACAWTDPKWSVGIDIERIRPTDILDTGPAFSRRERRLIGRIGDEGLAALVGWTVKEASWKALSLDRVGPEALEIEMLDAGTGRAMVRATDRGRRRVEARVGRVGAAGVEYLLAVAWAPRPRETALLTPKRELTSSNQRTYCHGTRDTSGCSRED